MRLRRRRSVKRSSISMAKKIEARGNFFRESPSEYEIFPLCGKNALHFKSLLPSSWMCQSHKRGPAGESAKCNYMQHRSFDICFGDYIQRTPLLQQGRNFPLRKPKEQEERKLYDISTDFFAVMSKKWTCPWFGFDLRWRFFAPTNRGQGRKIPSAHYLCPKHDMSHNGNRNPNQQLLLKVSPRWSIACYEASRRKCFFSLFLLKLVSIFTASLTGTKTV